jgi:hypothetical protein
MFSSKKRDASGSCMIGSCTPYIIFNMQRKHSIKPGQDDPKIRDCMSHNINSTNIQV